MMDSETFKYYALLRREERLAYHRMFNIGINPSLLCVYADLHRIVDTPAVDREPCHIISVSPHTTHLFTGTRMFRSLADVGRISKSYFTGNERVRLSRF